MAVPFHHGGVALFVLTEKPNVTVVELNSTFTIKCGAALRPSLPARERDGPDLGHQTEGQTL